MKTYQQLIVEVSADTDVLTIAHKRELETAHDNFRDAAVTAGRIRNKDLEHQQQKKKLKAKAKEFRSVAKRHMSIIRKIRKLYKERE